MLNDQVIEESVNSVTAMLLVVFQAVKIKIRFGVSLRSALLHCLRINQDMLWYKTFFFSVPYLISILCSAT